MCHHSKVASLPNIGTRFWDIMERPHLSASCILISARVPNAWEAVSATNLSTYLPCLSVLAVHYEQCMPWTLAGRTSHPCLSTPDTCLNIQNSTVMALEGKLLKFVAKSTCEE